MKRITNFWTRTRITWFTIQCIDHNIFPHWYCVF